MQETFSKQKTTYETIKIKKVHILKENTELPIAKNFTKPSKSTELPNCRKHFEVRRCPVRVLNNRSYNADPKLMCPMKIHLKVLGIME